MAHPVRGFFSPIIPSSMTSSVFSTQRRSHGSSFRTSFPSFLCHFFCTNLHFFKLQYTLARTEMQRKSAFSLCFCTFLCAEYRCRKNGFSFSFFFMRGFLCSRPRTRLRRIRNHCPAESCSAGFLRWLQWQVHAHRWQKSYRTA